MPPRLTQGRFARAACRHFDVDDGQKEYLAREPGTQDEQGVQAQEEYDCKDKLLYHQGDSVRIGEPLWRIVNAGFAQEEIADQEDANARQQERCGTTQHGYQHLRVMILFYA